VTGNDGGAVADVDPGAAGFGSPAARGRTAGGGATSRLGVGAEIGGAAAM